MIGSAVNRYPHWGWTFWDGLLSLGLGAMIIAMWPASSFWAIGVFVGIELFFHGFEFVGLGLLGKSIKASSGTSVGHSHREHHLEALRPKRKRRVTTRIWITFSRVFHSETRIL